MNTIAIDLTQQPMTLAELLAKAREGMVILLDASGERFVLSHADDFALEVELLKKNHDFLAFLDASKNEGKTLSLDEVEKTLR
jgi:hypothetical protein